MKTPEEKCIDIRRILDNYADKLKAEIRGSLTDDLQDKCEVLKVITHIIYKE